MTYDKENIFAKILKKEIPCEVVFENEFILAFKDINPQAKTHILIIPKGDYLDLSDFLQKASALDISTFWKSVDEVLVSLKLKDKGFQIKTHKGKDGGQEVFHFHLHLLSNH